MTYLAIAFIGGLFLIYSLTFRQLQKAEVTGPMFFIIGGLCLAVFLPHESNKVTAIPVINEDA